MPFIPEKEIELKSLKILRDFQIKSKRDISPPVILEDIVEWLFGTIVQVEDLRPMFPDEKDEVLGCSIFKNGIITVHIAKSLASASYVAKEKMLGRYRYTIAHEIGHLTLHLPDVIAKAQQAGLWDEQENNIVSVFRRSEFNIRRNRPPEEIQADLFAKYLLMPTQFILSAWEEIFGPDHGPENVFEEMEGLRKIAAHPEYVRAQIVRDMADLFDVSAEAMQYRLVDMKLLETEKQLQGTFGF